MRTTTGASALRTRSSDDERVEEREARDLRASSPSQPRGGDCAPGSRSASSGARRSSSSAAAPSSRAQRRAVEVLAHRPRTTSTHGQYAGAARPQPRVQMTARAVGGGVLGERRRQARLADAGIAEHEMHAAAPGARVVERVAELAELARRARPAGLRPAMSTL